MKIPKVAPIFPAIFPKDKRRDTLQVGDLVKEHTMHSKHRRGLITNKRSNYWLTIKWLNGDNNTIVSIYDVTKIKEGDTK
mgnify:CR=1 FL=1|jgi:hypothetical protein